MGTFLSFLLKCGQIHLLFYEISANKTEILYVMSQNPIKLYYSVLIHIPNFCAKFLTNWLSYKLKFFFISRDVICICFPCLIILARYSFILWYILMTLLLASSGTSRRSFFFRTNMYTYIAIIVILFTYKSKSAPCAAGLYKYFRNKLS